MISNSRLLVSELKRAMRMMQFDDFQTEYITAEVDGEEYVIDSIGFRNTHSDPQMTHLCLRLTKPRDIGGGIIR